MIDMKTMKRIGLTVLALGALTACATTAEVSTIPGMEITTALSRADYEIIGTATGEACAETSCFFGSCTSVAANAEESFLQGRMQSSSIRNVQQGNPALLGPLAFLLGAPAPQVPSASQIAERIATYKAIESIPNADAIVTPRKTMEVEGSSLLGITSNSRSCVTIRGKAIHIKSDAERK
jgi:hypothetical protein